MTSASLSDLHAVHLADLSALAGFVVAVGVVMKGCDAVDVVGAARMGYDRGCSVEDL